MLRLCLTISFKEAVLKIANSFYLVNMNEGGYKIRNQAAAHFITFAVVECLPD
jgi:hypothetical protein